MFSWGKVPIQDNETRQWEASGIRLLVRRARDEWHIAVLRLPAVSVEPPEAEEPNHTSRLVELDEIDWKRIVTTRDDTISLLPALPDRPVVVRPESSISILPGRWAWFYFGIPVWLRFVSTRNSEEQLVYEEATKILSNIWFGDPSLGELCYSVGDPLKRLSEQVGFDDFSAVCPLHVRNGSDETLNFERICVHVEHLKLYESENRLWTDDVNVLFKGSDQISQITITDRTKEGSQLITGQRIPANRSFIKRSFSLLRQVAGM